MGERIGMGFVDTPDEWRWLQNAIKNECRAEFVTSSSGRPVKITAVLEYLSIDTDREVYMSVIQLYY
jgi:hypothetical protein